MARSVPYFLLFACQGHTSTINNSAVLVVMYGAILLRLGWVWFLLTLFFSCVTVSYITTAILYDDDAARSRSRITNNQIDDRHFFPLHEYVLEFCRDSSRIMQGGGVI